jgi:predicted SAM-dependent methyltransferase
MEGWINLDVVALPGVDVVADLEQCRSKPLPFHDNEIDEFMLSHVIEHVRDSLGLMEELHRIAKPGAKAQIRVPFGGSDDAWADPTHVRPYYIDSFVYFSQPAYWRADYGYRGDWKTDRVMIAVNKSMVGDKKPAQIFQMINAYRNVATEMIAFLEAVKPAREPRQDLITMPEVHFSPV